MATNTQTKSLLSGVNAEYIAHLYAQYLRSAASVNQSWQVFFAELSDDEVTLLREMHGASWTPEENRTESRAFETKPEIAGNVAYLQPVSHARPALDASAAKDILKNALAERALRSYGHFRALLDPLGLDTPKDHAELPVAGSMPALEAIYCGSIGYEYMHIANAAERTWLQNKIETPVQLNTDQKKAALENLTKAEGLENFLGKRYVGVKRFGLEGGESTLVAVEEILHRASELGVKHAVLGMAHRGRLNVLTNVCGKPFTKLFAEFNGTPGVPAGTPGTGDVKYHMGYSSDRDMRGGQVHVTLAFNPSHLEFVNAVVGGRVRATQTLYNDAERAQVLPLLLHGDAAFAGQGVVPECLMMSQLPGYTVGGTVHVITNNQVGFTTSSAFARSGPYSSDVAKMIDAPIFHVNGDDPEAVLRVARLAIEYRQTFKKDVVIDLLCYRRNGHNETDEPAFTQPVMYQVIANTPTTRTLYAEKLAKNGALSAAESDAMQEAFKARLEADFEAAKSYKPNKADMLEGNWKGFEQSLDEAAPRNPVTAIDQKRLQQVIETITEAPQGFDLNSKIARQLEAKKQMLQSGDGYDWGTAEAIAFGGLLQDGYSVRLSGQDVGRGTFSHRHARFVDQKNNARYFPLQKLAANKAVFEAHDSPLSECAVMGFDYGYSISDPRTLVLWEGQFGDFANGAQVIIDQFVASAETKWLRMSGLTLLLPHGQEGQGPEHSSARLERFLQLSAEDNWSVVSCSTPANYFHVLRRQMLRNFRKPLVVMSPKSLLRHKLCVSKTADFIGNTAFQTVIDDTAVEAKNVKRVVLCSGKVYYDLVEAREAKKITTTALVRLEQFYPFPEKALADILAKYPKADVVWCQEEPENQGAWNFVDRRIEAALTSVKHKAARPLYVGRIPAAAPATGSAKTYAVEQEALVSKALG